MCTYDITAEGDGAKHQSEQPVCQLSCTRMARLRSSPSPPPQKPRLCGHLYTHDLRVRSYAWTK